MKKFIKVFLVFSFIIGVFFVVKPVENCYAEAVVASEVKSNVVDYDWHHYADMLTMGAGGVLAGLALFLPTYIKIKKAKSAIDMATSNSSTENTRNEVIFNSVKKLEDKLTAREKTLDKREKQLEDIERATQNMVEICKLAFTNSNELVSKGIADKIAKVGEENESSEKE